MFRLIAITSAFVLFVSGLTATLSVAGAVNKPGDIEFKAGMRVRQAVELAGVKKNADLKRVTVEENGETRIVDLAKLGPSPLLSEGAKITVPEFDAGRYVMVGGAVGNPGSFEYGKGITIREAVMQARPFDGAQVDSVKITRTLANGKTETTRVNLKDMQANADVLPGDYMEVAYPATATMGDRELLTIVVIALIVLLLVSR